MKSRRLALGLLATTLLACNGAPPPATPAGGIVAEDGTPLPQDQAAQELAAESVDVSPVPAPGAVVFHLRWRSPQESIDSAAKYGQVPPQLVGGFTRDLVRGAVEEGLERQVDVNTFADAIALDAPIDMVLIADVSQGGQIPEPILAVSVGLSSLDRALGASKGRPKKIGNGVWRIGTQDKYGEPCAVVAAAGKAPARLVCGENENDLLKVAPFVARNVATLPEPPHDLQAKVNLRPVLDKYGRNWANQARGLPVIAEEFKNGIPAFDEALMRAADALAQEAGALIQDADSVVIDAGFDAQKGLTMGLGLQFAGKRSWLAQVMTDGAAKQGPPPAMFWKLPASSTTASYGVGGDPALFQPILETAQRLLVGKLEEEKLGTSADRQAFAKLLRLPGGKHVTTVSASGHFANPSKTPKGFFDEVLGSSVGWYVFGFDEPSAQIRAYLDDLQKAYNRPVLQAELKKEMGSDAKHLPVVKTVPAPRQLGAGGFDLSIVVPGLEEPPIDPSAQQKTSDVEAHILVMADGNQTWVGFAFDREALADLMAKLKGAGQGPNLASNAAIKHLENEKHASATVLTLSTFVDAAKPIASTIGAILGGSQSSAIMSMFEQLPNKGQTPMIGVVDIVDGARPRVSLSLNVPRGTLQDVGFLIQKLAELDQASP